MAKIKNKQELIIKIKNAEGFSNEEKSQMLALLNESKTYGLVWEKSTEDAWEMLKDYVPVLKEDESKRIDHGSENPNHILIEGDNLNALTALSYTHEGKIDVIYIDPPYNTGNKDFAYYDDFCDEYRQIPYVDREDSYRHSKWLSFMEKRLNIAKRLLSERGVIFISIDDNEQANIELLCNEVFGENNKVSKLPRITKSSGKTTDKIAQNHDYLLFYTKNIDKVVVTGLPHDDEGFRFSDDYVESRGKYKLNQTLDYDSLSYSESLDYPITIEGITLYPGGSYENYLKRKAGNHRRADWAWRWSPDLYKFGLDNGFIVLKRSRNGVRIYTKTYQYVSIIKDGNHYKLDYKDRTKSLQSIDFINNIYSNDNAKKELGKIFNPIPFDYPKPTSIMNTLLKVLPYSSTILDFFAGSGTTLHATMQLNAEDGGHRQCILVTNNENNICEEVTFERNKRVIEGYTTPKGEKVKGLQDNNLRYFKVGFTPREKTDENMFRLAKNSVNLLRIKHDVYKEKQFGELENPYKRYRYFEEDGKQLLVILDTELIGDIVEQLEEMEISKPIPTYVFTTGAYPFTEDFKSVADKVELYPLPHGIYQACERNMPKMTDKEIENPEGISLSDEELETSMDDLTKEEA